MEHLLKINTKCCIMQKIKILKHKNNVAKIANK